MKNVEEYQTPEIYDAEYRSTDDFNIFLGIKDKGKVLDLACGTGRLTIALAKSGLLCTGLDVCEAMLKHASNKSKGLPVQYLLGDMTSFKLQEKFDLITMAGNAFQALLSEKEQIEMLSCVKEHLNENGVFAFNTRNSLSNELCIIDDYEWWHDFIDPKGNVVRVFGKQVFDPLKKTVLYTTKRIWPETETIKNIELRFTEIDELLVLLEKSFFQIIDVFGDSHKNKFTKESKDIFILCKKR